MELAEPAGRYSSARILVVDNEAANVRTLSRILQAAGYTNLVATTDPTEVLALFAEQEPDLVLLDLHMPVLDGVAVLERLAEAAAPHSYLPVLVLTGDSSQQARRVPRGSRRKRSSCCGARRRCTTWGRSASRTPSSGSRDP